MQRVSNYGIETKRYLGGEMKHWVFLASLLVGTTSYADNIKNMTRYVQAMENAFDATYAMKHWKSEHLNLDLDSQFSQLYDSIDGRLTPRHWAQLLKAHYH